MPGSIRLTLLAITVGSPSAGNAVRTLDGKLLISRSLVAVTQQQNLKPPCNASVSDACLRGCVSGL